MSVSKALGGAVVAVGAALGVLVCSWPTIDLQAQRSATTEVNWAKVTTVSRTSASLEVDVVPQMQRGEPLHDSIFTALRDLAFDHVRFLAWYPPVQLAVAALEPPQDGKTSWDFSLIDPIFADFMAATAGRPVVVDFATTPQWMWKTEKRHSPSRPDGLDWSYNEGTELRDPTMKEVADYHARLVSWYTKGGFTDEYGKWHQSGHKYKIDYWEVLNEIELEHKLSPKFYTELYDAIVTAVRKVAPEMKFVGLSLARITGNADPEYFEYFLNPANHKPGVPLDMISYHFYAVPTIEDSDALRQGTIFEQANTFLTAVKYVESIRKRLSPTTRTYVDELGIILPEASMGPTLTRPIPPSYWHLYGAYWAYVYGNLASLGVDIVAGNQFFGYPGFFAGTSMLDWETGKPNATYRVVRLMRDAIEPGDRLVESRSGHPNVYLQGVIKRSGARKLLLVNKRDTDATITLPDIAGARVETVDRESGAAAPATRVLEGKEITLRGHAVAVLTLRGAD